MHIQRFDSLQNASAPHLSAGPSATTPNSTGSNAKKSVSREAGGTIRSPSQQSLLEALQKTPEVRQDKVEAAKQRVASGEYLTRSAAEDTAAAIVITEMSSPQSAPRP
jgi:anti-sigma28 factor (negative regulator of flagellin synthesis)